MDAMEEETNMETFLNRHCEDLKPTASLLRVYNSRRKKARDICSTSNTEMTTEMQPESLKLEIYEELRKTVSEFQKELLLFLLEKDPELANSSEMSDGWNYIAAILNKPEGAIQESEFWKKFWYHAKFDAITRYSKYKKKTPVKLTTCHQRIVNLVAAKEKITPKPFPIIQPFQSVMSIYISNSTITERYKQLMESRFQHKVTHNNLQVTTFQKELLLFLMEKNPNLANCVCTKDEENKWDHIANILNKVQGSLKDAENWKKTWMEIRSRVCQRYFIYKTRLVELLPVYDKRVINLCGPLIFPNTSTGKMPLRFPSVRTTESFISISNICRNYETIITKSFDTCLGQHITPVQKEFMMTLVENAFTTWFEIADLLNEKPGPILDWEKWKEIWNEIDYGKGKIHKHNEKKNTNIKKYPPKSIQPNSSATASKSTKNNMIEIIVVNDESDNQPANESYQINLNVPNHTNTTDQSITQSKNDGTVKKKPKKRKSLAKLFQDLTEILEDKTKTTEKRYERKLKSCEERLNYIQMCTIAEEKHYARKIKRIDRDLIAYPEDTSYDECGNSDLSRKEKK